MMHMTVNYWSPIPQEQIFCDLNSSDPNGMVYSAGMWSSAHGAFFGGDEEVFWRQFVESGDFRVSFVMDRQGNRVAGMLGMTKRQLSKQSRSGRPYSTHSLLGVVLRLWTP
eukprot:764357-Amphidinium_carterae.2